METLTQLNAQMQGLVLFRSLLADKVLQKLAAPPSDTAAEAEKAGFCAGFASELFRHTFNWSRYLLDRILEDENSYMLAKAQGRGVPSSLEEALNHELSVLEKISRLTAGELKRLSGYGGFLPEWETSKLDFAGIYAERIRNIFCRGYGIFAEYHAFIMQDGEIVPVRNPDPTRLSQLSGYGLEREKVVRNTLALLEGKPAANTLLYGDAGTGKSSTVKAIANEFKERGLRLIEIPKNQLSVIPSLMERLSKNPLKFILFIDDLSFTRSDETFGLLKAILEGSVSAKTPNLVLYATSNRRHLVKENFSDRNGDDIHRNDTLEETISLSARFGLAVTFSKPDKKQYTEIVAELAEQYGLQIEPAELFLQAEAYALRRGGRSPRVARQFAEYLKTLE